MILKKLLFANVGYQPFQVKYFSTYVKLTYIFYNQLFKIDVILKVH